jgi:hypothetical protein
MLSDLRGHMKEINQKIESFPLDGNQKNGIDSRAALDLWDFYNERIEQVNKSNMHPYDFEVAIWVFVVGIASSLISQYIGNLIFLKP